MSDLSMSIGLSRPLRSIVHERFTSALASQSLIFSETQLAIIHSKAAIPFQLRYCPALSWKPTPSPKPASGSPSTKKKFDPFEDPSADLLVARLPDSNHHSHNLVLNKFPVIPNHFIIATRENKAQTDLLEEADLGLTHACLQAWHDDQHNLYAFFNSGEHSGASQPHRHLQFLPVEDTRGSTSSQWTLLCNQMTTSVHPELPLLQDPNLPILHLATPLPPTMTPSALHERYLLLMRATAILLASPHKYPSHIASAISAHSLHNAAIATESSHALFSYNLALTLDTMAILPRRAEDATIPEIHSTDGARGVVSINGTVLAGTLMVKNQEEWDVLRSKPLLDDMLRQIGFVVGDGAKM